MYCKLGDICDYVKEKIEITQITKVDYVSTENMLKEKQGIVEASNLPNCKWLPRYQKGDVLVSNIRPYFKKIWLADKIGGCSNDVLVFRAKEGINEKYLYYVLANDAFFTYSTATSKGTKMPRGDKNLIMEYRIRNFESVKQQMIASTLTSLDDRIVLNNKINENLEQQAQAIFKSWFVDFAPFGGVTPSDWTSTNLLGIADYLNGLAMQKFRPSEYERGIPVLKIKELRQGCTDKNSDFCSPNIKSEYVIEDGDVIFSWSGSLLVDFWCGGKSGLNQHLFKVTSSNYDKWFYYSWTRHHLSRFIASASAMATTMGHIKRTELEKAQVLIPTPKVYAHIGALLQPIYELIVNNRIENTRLFSLRDALLPKLVSGELDVSEIWG